MNLHIAQIGTGRVGRPTAYTIMCTGLASKVTVCDVKPGLAKAFAEELLHAAAGFGLDVEVTWCDRDEDVEGADIILVSAGEPRQPGIKMSRRDLAAKNTKIIKYIAETTILRNPSAKYIVITNPVDAMSMVFKRYSGAKFVISSGTSLETLRFKSRIAKIFKVSVSEIQGWVGGEHGNAAVILWSTVKIHNRSVEEYAKLEGIAFSKDVLESYVREISKFIVDNIGGTEYGPAVAFQQIVRAIVKDTKEIITVGTPIKWEKIPIPVHVSVPLKLGNTIGQSLFEKLTENERKRIEAAANIINNTYQTAIEKL